MKSADGVCVCVGLPTLLVTRYCELTSPISSSFSPPFISFVTSFIFFTSFLSGLSFLPFLPSFLPFLPSLPQLDTSTSCGVGREIRCVSVPVVERRGSSIPGLVWSGMHHQTLFSSAWHARCVLLVLTLPHTPPPPPPSLPH